MRILTLLLSFYTLVLSAQTNIEFEQLSRHKFTDGTKVAKLHKFRHVFEFDETSLTKYKKFNRARMTQNSLNGLFGLAFTTGVGYFVYEVNRECDQTNCFIGPSLAAIFSIGVLGIAATTNAIVIPIKNKRKRRLLESYFDNSSLSLLDDALPELNLGITANGMGLVVLF